MRYEMYVGSDQMSLVISHIWCDSWGYDHGKIGRKAAMIGGGILIRGFSTWMRIKFVADHPAWGIERILLHYHHHDHKEAIKAIAVLYEEFLQVKENFLKKGYTELDKELHKAVCDKYGASQRAPDCQECERS